MTPDASLDFPDSFPMGPPTFRSTASAYGKSLQLRRNRQVDDVDPGHACHRRAVAQPRDQRVDHRIVAARLHLDRAVELIAYPSVETQSTRLVGRRCPKSDALHTSADDNADLLHRCMRKSGAGLIAGCTSPG